jgi:hypothetical protein
MGTHHHPESGAVERIYGALRDRPYKRMSLSSIARTVGPSMSAKAAQGNTAHCRNRFAPYVRRVGTGVYMYTPGGHLDDLAYPEVPLRKGRVKELRTERLVAVDQTRARQDAELVRQSLEAKAAARHDAEPEPTGPEPVTTHLSRVTYTILGTKNGEVYLLDSDMVPWKLVPMRLVPA